MSGIRFSVDEGKESSKKSSQWRNGWRSLTRVPLAEKGWEREQRTEQWWFALVFVKMAGYSRSSLLGSDPFRDSWGSSGLPQLGLHLFYKDGAQVRIRGPTELCPLCCSFHHTVAESVHWLHSVFPGAASLWSSTQGWWGFWGRCFLPTSKPPALNQVFLEVRMTWWNTARGKERMREYKHKSFHSQTWETPRGVRKPESQSFCYGRWGARLTMCPQVMPTLV